MKKIIISIFIALFSVICSGKDNGALKFLGIPIDGTESQFASKLKDKGFTYNSLSESYKGQFNGKIVDVYIHTNHNLVDRVYVAFPYTSEESIRIEFNTLLGQFNDNGKYLDLSMNEEIPEKEDISYQISVNKKRYQASFSYFDPDQDKVAFMNALLDKFSDFFTKDQLTTLKEYCIKAMEAPASDQETLQADLMAKMQAMGLTPSGDETTDQEKSIRFLAAYLDGMKSLADGDVWFMIHEYYGRFQIGLYYDNRHNQAHGEDL